MQSVKIEPLIGYKRDIKSSRSVKSVSFDKDERSIFNSRRHCRSNQKEAIIKKIY